MNATKLMAKASRRVRQARGSQFLTHGSDSYDKAALHRAHRLMARAMIEEQVEEMNAAEEPEKVAVSYRVVVSTQYLENYGAHDWDGRGECPQYWKCKGGEDYIIVEGLTEYDVLTTFPEDYVDRSAIERRSHYSEEYIISVSFVPSTEETYREGMVREMVADRYMSQAEGDRYLQECRKYLKAK